MFEFNKMRNRGYNGDEMLFSQRGFFSFFYAFFCCYFPRYIVQFLVTVSSLDAVNANFLRSLLRVFTAAIVQSAADGIIRGIIAACLMERNERYVAEISMSSKYKERIYFPLNREREKEREYTRGRYMARGAMRHTLSSDIRIKIFALRWADSIGRVY